MDLLASKKKKNLSLIGFYLDEMKVSRRDDSYVQLELHSEVSGINYSVLNQLLLIFFYSP